MKASKKLVYTFEFSEQELREIQSEIEAWRDESEYKQSITLENFSDRIDLALITKISE